MSEPVIPPDGGTPAPVDTDGDIPLHNLGDLQKAIEERDKYKARWRKVQELMSGGGEKPPDGNDLTGMLQNTLESNAALKTQAADAAKAAADATAMNRQLKLDMQHRELTDVVMQGVNEQNKDAVRLMIPGLLAEKKVDLTQTEDVKQLGKDLRKKLTDSFPGFYGPEDGQGGGGTPGVAKVNYANTTWSQLTEAQRREVSPEDFGKYFDPSDGPDNASSGGIPVSKGR